MDNHIVKKMEIYTLINSMICNTISIVFIRFPPSPYK